MTSALDYDSVTEPLRNGDPLPEHPHDTTGRKITAYGFVFDAGNNVRCTAGLHRNEITVLKSGQRILAHAYRYAIVDRKIYHTRESVVIHVQTEPVE